MPHATDVGCRARSRRARRPCGGGGDRVRREARVRREPLWLAHLVHRVAGLVLGTFLPVHFLVLGRALERTDTLDAFLRWGENPAVKLAESILVLALGLHLFGGLRLLALEFLPWSPAQKTYAAAAAGLAVILSLGFFFNAV